VRQDPLFPSSLNAIAGSVRQDVPTRTGMAGQIWYVRRLGAPGFFICKGHNLITALKRRGRANPSGAVIRARSRLPE
jgi:hypothetical protein